MSEIERLIHETDEHLRPHAPDACMALARERAERDRVEKSLRAQLAVYVDGERKLRAEVERLRKENAKLRAVAEAAKDLTGWDWLHLLDDSTPSYSNDVISDVEKIRAALAKLEAP